MEIYTVNIDEKIKDIFFDFCDKHGITYIRGSYTEQKPNNGIERIFNALGYKTKNVEHTFGDSALEVIREISRDMIKNKKDALLFDAIFIPSIKRSGFCDELGLFHDTPQNMIDAINEIISTLNDNK